MIIARMIRASAIAAAAMAVLSADIAAAQEKITVGRTAVKSGPVCGGIVGGQLQPACGKKPAAFESAALGECPAGSFFDIGLWSCWKCPDGFYRTSPGVSLAAVDTDKACARRSNLLGGDEPATFIKNVACGPGTFWDGIDNGTCWKSCPSGYYRTLEHVKHANACAKGVFGPFARAQFSHKNHCEPGETNDPRNGGECWRCPEGSERNLLTPINGSAACHRPSGWEFARATRLTTLTCPADQHFDFIDLTQQDIRTRPELKGKNVSPVASGTCWSCPANYGRTTAHVKSNEACEAKAIEWRTGDYPEPGLFGLSGADAVVLDLLRNHRKTIDDAIPEVATAMDLAPDVVRKDTWTEIKSTPEKSSLLLMAIFGRILFAIDEPGQATAADKQLLESFGKYIQARRTFIAEDALAAYKAWDAAKDHWYRQRSGATTLTGFLPPDFFEVVHAGSMVGLGAAPALTVGGAYAATHVKAVRDAIWPKLPAKRMMAFEKFKLQHGKEIAKAFVAEKMKALDKVKFGAQRAFTRQAEEKVAQAAAKAAARAGAVSIRSLAAIGPQIVVAVAVEIAIVAIEVNTEIETAEGKLHQKVAEAKQPVEFARLLDRDGGLDELVAYWTLATVGHYDEHPRKPSAQSVAAITDIADDALGIKKPQPRTTITAKTTIVEPGNLGPTVATPSDPAAKILQIENAAAPGLCLGFAGTGRAAVIAACAQAPVTYFDGASAMGPYQWQDGPTAIARDRKLTGAVAGGQAHGQTMMVCRAPLGGSVYPGKTWDGFCYYGHGGKALAFVTNFQILFRNVPPQQDAAYPVSWHKPDAIDARSTFVGGNEGNNKSRVCRAQLQDGVHPGREVAGTCRIGWADKEVVATQYEVLALGQAQAGQMTSGPTVLFYGGEGDIRPSSNPNECLGLNPSGGGVRLEACDPKTHKWQRWDMLPDGRIRNENSFLCLEPQRGQTSAGAVLNVGTCRSPASVWRPKS